MKCFDELQYAMYLDNQLGPNESEQIKTHITECNTCKQLINQLERENNDLRSAFSSDTTVDIESIVLNRLQNEPQKENKTKPRHRYGYRRTFSYAASLTAVALLVIYFAWFGDPKVTNDSSAETQVILCSAKVDDKEVQSHVFHADESETYIWLEKE